MSTYYEDLSGKVFGFVTAINRENTGIWNNGKINWKWKCECECGNIVYFRASKLKSKKQLSCGCKYKKHTYAGQKFTRLTTIKKVAASIWLCKCDCGKERNVSSGSLLRGGVKSCGCLRGWALRNRGSDLAGHQIGKLTIICEDGKNKHGNTMWKAKCSCGNETRVSTSYLNLQGSKSCGCQKELNRKLGNWSGYEEISGSMWSQIVRCGKCRDLEFTITIEYVWNLYIQQKRRCSYTGQTIYFPKNKFKKRHV